VALVARAHVIALVAVATAACSGSCSSCSKSSAGATDTAPSPSASVPALAEAGVDPAPEALGIEDVAVGKGREAKVGDTIRIHYVATLAESGTEFDSSRRRGAPFELVLGTGRVIRGWDQGMIGMRVGGTRRVTIPPSFGYGDSGAPPLIPPKATLVFEIELLAVKGK
jgi:FKBP-type peptidyl-prolyl cis-trans isomerase